MRFPAIAVLVCALMVAPAGIVRGDPFLINPGAETGDLTGWTVGGNSNPNVDSGTFNPSIKPHTGSYDFSGHRGTFGTLTQNVSLAGVFGGNYSLIDAGQETASISFWEQGLNQGATSDSAYVSLTFLSAGNATLGTVSSPEIDSHSGTWQNFTGTYSVPVGTRSINYTMNFVLHSGNDIDSYIDDNSLTLAVVPEPSSIAMLGIGCLALLGYARHRKLATKTA
jgi:hypothetical protein